MGMMKISQYSYAYTSGTLLVTYEYNGTVVVARIYKGAPYTYYSQRLPFDSLFLSVYSEGLIAL